MLNISVALIHVDILKIIRSIHKHSYSRAFPSLSFCGVLVAGTVFMGRIIRLGLTTIPRRQQAIRVPRARLWSYIPSSPSHNNNIPTHQQPVGVGLHYQLPIWVDNPRLLASHNYNTPTAGRRGATLSATYLGGHLTFTSITQLQHTNSR